MQLANVFPYQAVKIIQIYSTCLTVCEFYFIILAVVGCDSKIKIKTVRIILQRKIAFTSLL